VVKVGAAKAGKGAYLNQELCLHPSTPFMLPRPTATPSSAHDGVEFIQENGRRGMEAAAA
jgi:hypothetical protein